MDVPGCPWVSPSDSGLGLQRGEHRSVGAREHVNFHEPKEEIWSLLCEVKCPSFEILRVPIWQRHLVTLQALHATQTSNSRIMVSTARAPTQLPKGPRGFGQLRSCELGHLRPQHDQISAQKNHSEVGSAMPAAAPSQNNQCRFETIPLEKN